jgi:acetyl esterase/lipase
MQRRHLLTRLLGGAVATVALLAATGCEWPEGTRYVDTVFDDVEATTGVVYRSTTTHDGAPIDLRLDIYEPAGDTNDTRPAVFWMFGGAWQGGDRQQMAAYARDSAHRGYVGVTIDYRIRPTGGVDAAWDAYEDAVAAAQWLTDNAGTYGIDPDAIVAGGYSAGAINAVNLLFAPGTRDPAEPPVAGAVAIAGMTFAGPTSGRPPLIMHHGTADNIVQYSWAQDACEDTLAAGNHCDLFTYEGAGHGIAFSHAGPIRDESHHLIFERVLWPLGYRVEQVN